MYRVRAASLCDLDDALGVQVALDRVDTDLVGLVGYFDVQAVLVGLGVDGDVFDVQIFAGADHANGDLSAVCDQNFMYHLAFLSLSFFKFYFFVF